MAVGEAARVTIKTQGRVRMCFMIFGRTTVGGVEHGPAGKWTVIVRGMVFYRTFFCRLLFTSRRGV